MFLDLLVYRCRMFVDETDELRTSFFKQARLAIVVCYGVLWNGELGDLLKSSLLRSRNA